MIARMVSRCVSATMPAAWSVEVLLEMTPEEARRQVSPRLAAELVALAGRAEA